MTELEVPDAAIEELYEWVKGDDHVAVRAIAALVVAAELRRLADYNRDQADVGWAYDRADELDGGAS